MVSPYPLVGLCFRVQLFDSTGAADAATGLDDGAFQEVTGLSAKMETESYREGGENRFDRSLPTGVKYEPLKLTRGVLGTDRPIAQWCRTVLQGNFVAAVQPREVMLQLLQADAILKVWLFHNAWPIHWEVAGLHSTEGKLVVETLELRYDYFEPIPNPVIN